MDTKKSYKIQASGSKLKNKKILITAGPTWIPIDSVRVISNIATGETGVLLAKGAAKKGAKVTLVLGPIPNAVSLRRPIKVIRFKFFDELKKIIISELKSHRYDAVIHSAAVSDFKPEKITSGKIISGKIYNLKLLPLPKIIDDVRKLAPRAKLVMFKLEPKVSESILIKRARSTLAKVGADFAVANRINPYRAHIIDRRGKILTTIKDKKLLAKNLLTFLTYNL
ncbi:MAG: phosphopantothenoylcysteine decarboxylase [Candidatus Omnitrophota bacterium]